MNYLKNTLELALSLKRPYAGKSVQILKDFLIATLPHPFEDYDGNVHCTVGVGSRTLFSAHTDTVHRDDGKNNYVLSSEQVISDGKPYGTRVMYRAHGAPLGADDGAGCALLVHLAMNGVPGHYVFHHAEEVGGIGSKALADTDFFNGNFDRAIAFDRKATHSIITRQSTGYCCSQLFADALSDALNAADETFMFASDDTGVYTDTAEYVDQIPECTNVSCGYYNEHGNSESLDYTFLEALSKALLKIDFEVLPIGVRGVEPVHMYNYSPGFGLAPDPVGYVDYDAEDEFYNTLASYPEIMAKFTDEQIEDAVQILGGPGIYSLLDDLDDGVLDEAILSNILHNPTGYIEDMKNFHADQQT